MCLASGNLTATSQAEILLRHWRTIDGFIASRIATRGALIVNVTRDAVAWLDGDGWRTVKHKR